VFLLDWLHFNILFLGDRVGILNASSYDHRQHQQANGVRGKQFKENQTPVHHFATVHLARAHFSKLDGVDSLPMVASVEVLLGCEEYKEAVKEKSCSGLAVLTVIYDDTEVVNLSDQAKVKKRPCFASYKHSSFAEVDAIAD